MSSEFDDIWPCEVSVSYNDMIIRSDIYVSFCRSMAYETCDPRVLASADKMESKADSVGLVSDDSHVHLVSRAGYDVPGRYRRVQSHRGKEKMKIFNYHGYNVSCLWSYTLFVF